MDISVSDLGKWISTFIGRNHFMIFFILVIAGLIAAIVALSSTLSSPDIEGYTSSIDNMSLDDGTLNKLKSLGQTSEEVAKPSGRTNPF